VPRKATPARTVLPGPVHPDGKHRHPGRGSPTAQVEGRRHYPRRSVRTYRFAHFIQTYQSSPIGLSGRPAFCPFEDCSAFTRVAACTLAPSPICDTLIEGFSHFVTSMTAPIASGWSGCRMGFAPTGKRRLCTAHTPNRHWLHAATEGSCLLRDTRDCHDDREGRGGTVLRFIRAMPATQYRAMAAGSSRSSGHKAFDQGLSCSSEMSLLV
jgi:hypothetical protein